MCACQLVHVFGIQSCEYPRDYVVIAVRSALRNFFCRCYCCVVCPPFSIAVSWFLAYSHVHVSLLLYIVSICDGSHAISSWFCLVVKLVRLTPKQALGVL